MDGDHSSPEPPERAVSGGARSYDCIFCKRGFSNAQALGGHMNIHRKDKARLKQPPYDVDDRTSSSSVSIKDSVVSSYSLSTRNFSSSRLSHGEHIIGASTTLPFKWPWIAALPREQDIQEEVGRGGEDNIETCTHSNNRQEGGEPEAMELDLELRLGPEPPRASMTSLKEFL
ncbi:hypothetical protein J5N97_002380 [Dioscorea zingiberensis]|uniref:C2H2-type domain-containing protein n=1 Tax=Dioscorea zingiberensis TaxID=325984 RepID=A0A9D5D3P7_9LILI|nr:hypothetical protein J5N97_002380 [Dioscorea zingiberensis]